MEKQQQRSQSGAAIRYLANTDESLPFSSAVQIGALIFLSGEIGVLPSGELARDVLAQSRQALENIEATLRRMGCSRDDIVKCTVMLRDMESWQPFNEIYREFFSGRPLPARSAFASGGLAYGAEVEIECVAIR